jgi:acetyltransferase
MKRSGAAGGFPEGLDAVFSPRSVAVVGASDEPGKAGTMLLRNLAGFQGEVLPVSTSREEVAGLRAYRSLREVPGGVDLVIAAVPAQAVPDVIDDAAAAGAGAVVVLSGGFAETGKDGMRLQEQVVRKAREGGLRIVGPNCLGVQNCATGMNASMSAGTPEAAGRISLATQSGAYGMAIYTLALEQQMRFAKVYAAGNKADLSDAEVLSFLGDDPDSQILCFFVESLSDGRGFYERARHVSRRKPILLTKTGRTAAGARAAISHTAALAGDTEVWQAALAQAGVVVAHSGLEMMDAAKALDWQPAPGGPRAGIVTNSGGTGVELTDLLSEEGLSVPELSPSLQAELAAALPSFGSPRNPVDVTTAWARFAELYPLGVERLARSGEVDVVVPVLLQRSAMDSAVAEGVRDAVARLRADDVEVPVYVCWVAPSSARPNAELLQAGGVPCFAWPQRTARAAGLAWRYTSGRASLRPIPEPVSPPPGLPPVAAGALQPEAAASLVRAFGVEVAEQALCEDPQAAARAARRIGFPVVIKLAGGRHTHKSDVGGVRLGLADPDAVAAAASELLEIDAGGRLLVQPMLDGTEVIVGGFRDPEFGPVVMVGLGGVFVEVLRDVAFRLAPIDAAEAQEAIESLRGFPLLAGARGAEPADLEALARTVAGASQLLAAVPQVAELDLNPVMARPDGVAAVDVRVIGAPGESSDSSATDSVGKASSALAAKDTAAPLN